MFYPKEEKTRKQKLSEHPPFFKRYIDVYIYKTTNRKPYVNIISENNIGALAAPQLETTSAYN